MTTMTVNGERNVCNVAVCLTWLDDASREDKRPLVDGSALYDPDAMES
jgi:hypothetical protein